jgi:hypothetical protein
MAKTLMIAGKTLDLLMTFTRHAMKSCTGKEIITYRCVGVYLLLLIISPLSLVTSRHITHTVVLLVASLSPQRCLLVTSAEVCYSSLVFTLLLTVPRLVTSRLGNSIALSTRDFR